MAGSISLTHVLFVDDVLIFRDGTLLDWLHFKSLINLFCSASWMTVSMRKFSFGFLNISQEVISRTEAQFYFPWKSMDDDLSRSNRTVIVLAIGTSFSGKFKTGLIGGLLGGSPWEGG